MRNANPMFRWTQHDPDIANPQTFTTDIYEGKITFWRGRTKVVVTDYQISRLIDADDFYADVDKLLTLAGFTEDFGREVEQILNSEARFIKLVDAKFDDSSNYTTLSFALDLPKLDLEPVDFNDRFPKYKNCDFMVTVPWHNIDYQDVIDSATIKFFSAIKENYLKPVDLY